jgi:hypothetical protein
VKYECYACRLPLEFRSVGLDGAFLIGIAFAAQFNARAMRDRLCDGHAESLARGHAATFADGHGAAYRGELRAPARRGGGGGAMSGPRMYVEMWDHQSSLCVFLDERDAKGVRRPFAIVRNGFAREIEGTDRIGKDRRTMTLSQAIRSCHRTLWRLKVAGDRLRRKHEKAKR